MNTLTQKFPDRENDKLKFTEIFEKQGRLEEAKEIYKNELILNPFDTSLQLNVAYIEYRNKNIDEAFRILNNTLQNSSNFMDNLKSTNALSSLNKYSGKIAEAQRLYTQFEKLNLRRSVNNANIENVVNRKAQFLFETGKGDQVLNLANRLFEQYPDRLEGSLCKLNTFAIVHDYETIMSPDEFEECYVIFNTYAKGYGEYVKVLSAYTRGDYRKCIKIIEDNKKTLKRLLKHNALLAKIYDRNGQKDKAIEVMNNIMNTKPFPNDYYIYATILEEKSPEKALDYVNIALEFWKNADENYIPKQRALTLKQSLEN